jgi:ferritin
MVEFKNIEYAIRESKKRQKSYSKKNVRIQFLTDYRQTAKINELMADHHEFNNESQCLYFIVDEYFKTQKKISQLLETINTDQDRIRELEYQKRFNINEGE